MNSLLSDAKYFDDSTTKFQEIRTLLDSKDHKDKLEALKRLLAMMTMGKDVAMFFPDVVKNVVVDSIEIKKLVYLFLVHYSETNQDLALLSINTFQRDLKSDSPRIRGNAICAMASIRVPVVVPLIVLALKQCIKDSSSYVRRSAAQAIPQIYFLDKENQYETCCDMIAELLTNIDPAVLPSTLYAFSQVCPTNWSILHAHFRKLCHLIADFDPLGQALTLKILTNYARAHLPLPTGYFPLEYTPPPSSLLSQGLQPLMTQADGTSIGSINIDDLTSTAAQLLNSNTSSYNNGTTSSGERVSNALAKFRQSSSSPFYDDDDATNPKAKGGKKGSAKKTAKGADAVSGAGVDRFSTFDDETSEDFFSSLASGSKSSAKKAQVPSSPPKPEPERPLSPEHPQSPQQMAPQPKPIDPDLALLLRSATSLLHTPSVSVIVEVAALYQAFAPKSLYPALLATLVRMHRTSRTQAFVLLSTIATFATRVPQMLNQYLDDFHIVQTDPVYIRTIKLDILSSLLLTPENANSTFKEMISLCRMPEKDVVCKAIEILSKCCLLVPTLCGVTLRVLFSLLESPNDAVTAYASATMRLLLQRHARDIPIVVLKKVCHLLVTKIDEPLTRSTILWLISEHAAKITPHACEILRQFACTFADEHVQVKLQVLNLAVKCYLLLPQQQNIALLFKYVMDLSKYDINIDIRDKARMYRAIFFRKKVANPDEEELVLPQEAKEELKKILTLPRPPTEPLSLGAIRDHFCFGSLSHVLARKIRGYKPFPLPPQESLGAVERENLPPPQERGIPAGGSLFHRGSAAPAAGSDHGSSPNVASPQAPAKNLKPVANNKKHFDAFYDDDDSDDDDEEEEDEDEEEDDDEEEEEEEEEEEDEDEEEEETPPVRPQRNTNPQDAFSLLNASQNKASNQNNFFDTAGNAGGGFFDF